MRVIFKNRRHLFIVGAMLAFNAIAQTTTPPAPRPIAKAPALALAIEAAQHAVAVCAGNGFKVAVSVVDAEGGVKALIVADQLPTILGAFATRKAFTSITFKLPTSVVEQQSKTDQAMAARIATDPTKFLTYAGGLPIIVNNEVIGAIGVGGASDSRQDEVCAVEAIKKIQDRLR